MTVRSIEYQIARKVMQALLKAGFELRIHEGEDWASKRSNKLNYLMGEMFSTGEDRIFAYKVGEKQHSGWAYIIEGNGHDALSDYTCSLEEILDPVLASIQE